jgi:hypothetical protein
LGAELHRVLREESDGMWFKWWFEEFTEVAAAQIREEVSRRVGAGVAIAARSDLNRVTGAAVQRAKSVGPRGEGIAG